MRKLIRPLIYALSAVLAHLPLSASVPAGGSPEKAHDFTLTAIDGTSWTLSGLKGKIVVLEWTNPGCPFVVRHYEKEGLPGIQQNYTSKGVIWLTVNSTNPDHSDFRSPSDHAGTFSKWESAASAHLLDENGTVGRNYGAKTTPHIFIIDNEGRLVYQGAVDDDPRGKKERTERIMHVVKALDALLAGNKPEVSTTQPYGCSVKYAK